MKLKELRALIASKKEEARGYLKDDKLKEAEDVTAEIRELERKLKIQEMLEEEERNDVRDDIENRKKPVNEMRAIVKSVMGAELTEEERAVIKTDGNAAVLPKEFVKQVQEIEKGYGSLEEDCDVILVTKNEGSMPIVDLDQNELKDVTEGDDIVEGSLVTKDISYKCSKVGLIQTLSSELVDDAEIEIESLVKKNFTNIAVVKKNAKILKVIQDNATEVKGTSYEDVEKEIDKALPAVKSSLKVYMNTSTYADIKNKKDSTGQPLNLITIVNGEEVFNKKPIRVIDDELMPLAENKTNLFYLVNPKEAVKFFKRKEISIAKSTEAGFTNDTVKFRILTRIAVVKGATRSIKKIEY